MKKIEKEIKVTKYVSFDGIEFESEQICHAYESSKLGELLKEIDGIIIKRVNSLDIFVNKSMAIYGSCEPYNQYYVVVPKTRHDVFILNQILEISGNREEQVRGNDCFNMIILAVDVCCNSVCSACIIRLSDIVKDLTDGRFMVVSDIKECVTPSPDCAIPAKDSAKPEVCRNKMS